MNNRRLPLLCALISLLVFGSWACDDDPSAPSELSLSLLVRPDAGFGSPGIEYTFTPVVTGLPSGVYFEWDFDDGSPTITRQSPDQIVHIFEREGRYFVRLRIVAESDGFVAAEAQYEANIRGTPEPVDMVLIPAGSFQMGSDLNFSEQPVHQVRISQDFYLGKFEITQSQYRSVTGYTGSWYEGDNRPVENVSWFDAIYYCNQLSVREGYQPCYSINGNQVSLDRSANGYRLPTEAEWEYACRAGTTTDIYSGSLVQPLSRCNVDDPPEPNLLRVAWFCRNARGTTQPVGLKEANDFGLYDMHGNVAEWVWDWFDIDYYSTSPRTDPHGPTSGQTRILRGGSHAFGVTFQRSASRGADIEPQEFSSFYGFRIARNAE